MLLATISLYVQIKMVKAEVTTGKAAWECPGMTGMTEAAGLGP